MKKSLMIGWLCASVFAAFTLNLENLSVAAIVLVNLASAIAVARKVVPELFK